MSLFIKVDCLLVHILFSSHVKALGVNILVCSSLLVLLFTQGVNGYE